MAGKNHLDQISKKNITKEELFRYFETFVPNRCYFLERYINRYTISEIIGYNGIYDIESYRVEECNNRIIICNDTYADQFSVKGVIDLVLELKNRLYFDIVTTFNIYQNFRTECKNYKSILGNQLLIDFNNIKENVHITEMIKYLIVFIGLKFNLEAVANNDRLTISYLIATAEEMTFDNYGIFN